MQIPLLFCAHKNLIYEQIEYMPYTKKWDVQAAAPDKDHAIGADRWAKPRVFC